MILIGLTQLLHNAFAYGWLVDGRLYNNKNVTLYKKVIIAFTLPLAVPPATPIKKGAFTSEEGGVDPFVFGDEAPFVFSVRSLIFVNEILFLIAFSL